MIKQNDVLDNINWLLKTIDDLYKNSFIPAVVESSIDRLKELDASGINAMIQDAYERFRVLKIVKPDLYEVWEASNQVSVQDKIKLKVLEEVIKNIKKEA